MGTESKADPGFLFSFIGPPSHNYLSTTEGNFLIKFTNKVLKQLLSETMRLLHPSPARPGFILELRNAYLSRCFLS